MKTLYTIKPFKWRLERPSDFNVIWVVSVSRSFSYKVSRYLGSLNCPWRVELWFQDRMAWMGHDHDTLESATQEAWHDWLSRITPALEEVANVKDEDLRS